MDFNNNEIQEKKIILYIAKPLSQSKYIENLVLSTPPQHQKKTIQKKLFEIINPCKKYTYFFNYIFHIHIFSIFLIEKICIFFCRGLLFQTTFFV